MAENTKIEWADATFNPWIGCEPVSLACANCYAAALNKRFGHDNFGKDKARRRTSLSNWKVPFRLNRKAQTKLTAWEQMKKSQGVTDQYLIDCGFIKPTRPRVFCGSMCDIFDPAVPEDWRADLFGLINQTPNLDWLLLTKRIGNAHNMLSWSEPWANVWLGITVCNQTEADRDIPKLLQIPATKRFLSIEPMLGAIDLANLAFLTNELGKIEAYDNRDNDIETFIDSPESYFPTIDWIIVGGESGRNARPMHPDWARSLRDQCKAAGVPFMLKQWGEWMPSNNSTHMIRSDTGHVINWSHPESDCDAIWSGIAKVGKKKAGRLLDGVEHMEYSE